MRSGSLARSTRQNMTLIRRTFKTVIIFVFSLSAVSSSSALKRFDSPAKFSVRYPAPWFRIGTLGERLSLLSSEGGAEGIVIKPGQAEIVVTAAQVPPAATLTEVIEHYSEGASILSRIDIRNAGAGKQGCSELKEVVSEEHAVPPTDTPIPSPYIINTDLFCEAGGHNFVTLLRNWKGDKRQGQYQRVALNIMRSLRVTQ